MKVTSSARQAKATTSLQMPLQSVQNKNFLSVAARRRCTSIRLFGVLLHQMFCSVITGPRLDLRPFPATLNDTSHTLPAFVRRLVYFPPRQTSHKPEQLLVQTIVEAKSFLFRTTTESVQTESYTNQTWLNLQLRIP